ncbi:hypothetical protein DFH07DRAFT_782311 [Mycena maculata]|uniref:Uncharacterized protein n=1 Tax=Mycena maculata TaxID=230809 RepID=A0AAD7HUN8_9AGAR|nr:hypothetical protein DFH07DRAFT_782311 [Mycena maculata]
MLLTDSSDLASVLTVAETISSVLLLAWLFCLLISGIQNILREAAWYLPTLNVDEPELTAIQLPSYRMKHGQRAATGLDTNNEDMQLHKAEIQLQCSVANSSILAAWDLDYRGQAGITCSQCNVQKAHLMQMLEISMYNRAQDALLHLDYLAKDTEEPYALLSVWDTLRNKTHLHTSGHLYMHPFGVNFSWRGNTLKGSPFELMSRGLREVPWGPFFERGKSHDWKFRPATGGQKT